MINVHFYVTSCIQSLLFPLHSCRSKSCISVFPKCTFHSKLNSEDSPCCCPSSQSAGQHPF